MEENQDQCQHFNKMWNMETVSLLFLSLLCAGAGQAQGEHAHTHRQALPQPGIEPTTILIWGHSVNHWVAGWFKRVWSIKMLKYERCPPWRRNMTEEKHKITLSWFGKEVELMSTFFFKWFFLVYWHECLFLLGILNVLMIPIGKQKLHSIRTQLWFD